MYFITTFKKISTDDLGLLDLGNVRTVGYYNRFEDAELIVMDDVYDIWETTYNYAVIEKYNEGVYSLAEEFYYYKFNENTGRYDKINTPKELKNMCGLALG